MGQTNAAHGSGSSKDRCQEQRIPDAIGPTLKTEGGHRRSLPSGQVTAPGILEEALRSSSRDGDGGSSAATTTQTPNVIPAQERRANGLASRGPRSSLTPETALEIAGLLESGVSIEGIAERTGHPASTVRHWVRSGRVAASGRSQQNTTNT